MDKPGVKPSRYTTFNNRRNYPRFRIDLPVTITGPTGEVLKGMLYDLSPDGVQFRFPLKEGHKFQSEKNLSGNDAESSKCNLQFELNFDDSITQIRIDAYPVYLRPVSDSLLASGMFFSKENLSENKKISDFLFYQLQSAFAEIENINISDEKIRKEAVTTDANKPANKKQKQDKKDNEPAGEKIIASEVERLVLQMDFKNNQLDPMKQLLFSILGSLKTIQEISRHIDERVHIIEHKISRRG